MQSYHPIDEPVLVYCQLDRDEKLAILIQAFLFKKVHLEISLHTGGHFVQASVLIKITFSRKVH